MKSIFWIFIFFNSLVFSQKNQDDFKAKEIILDSILNGITNDKNPEKTVRVADSLIVSIGLNQKLKAYKVRAHHIKSFGLYLLQKGDLSLKEAKMALSYFDNDSTLIKKLPDIYTATSFTAYYYAVGEGNFHLGYSILLKALKNIDTSDHENKASIIMNLADLNLLMNDKEKAKQLAYKSLNIKNISDLNKNLSYLTLGNIYKVSNLDSAYYYYDKASHFFKKRNPSTFYGNNVSMAGIFIKKGELKKAKEILLEAEKHQRENNDITLIGKTYMLLSEIAGYEKNKVLELNLLKKADRFLKGNIYLLEREELYKSFINYYKKEGDFSKKRLYEIKAQNIKDSIQYRENVFLVKELEAKHKNEAKIQEIKRQKEFIETQESQKKNLYIALILIVFLLIFTVILYKKKLKTQKILLSKQEQLSNEKLKTLQEAQKVKTIQSHLEGQNDERRRIAKDLHDSISGNLAAIKMKLTNIDKDQSNQVNNIISNIDDTYNQVRLISHNLLPQENTKQNFTQRLKILINLYKTKELHIEFDVFPEDEINHINDNIQSEIHKILQELMTNITKHSQASKAIVNITLHDNYLNLLVEDNGLGFDKNKISLGIGFQNVSSRVNDLKGTFEIDSIKGKGATITINIPITK